MKRRVYPVASNEVRRGERCTHRDCIGCGVRTCRTCGRIGCSIAFRGEQCLGCRRR